MSGSSAGRIANIPAGGMVVVGPAADRAQFAVPHDNHMSGVHFAVECGPSGYGIIGKKSTNGTFLNRGPGLVVRS